MCFTKEMQVRGGKEAEIVSFPLKKTLLWSNTFWSKQNLHYFSNVEINACKILDVNVKGYTACYKVTLSLDLFVAYLRIFNRNAYRNDVVGFNYLNKPYIDVRFPPICG